MVDDKCVAVPLTEQLRSVPRDAVLRIDTPNALGCMDTRSIPIGRLCHEAADALGVKGLRLLTGRERQEAYSDCREHESDVEALQRKFCEVNGLTLGVLVVDHQTKEQQEDRP